MRMALVAGILCIGAASGCGYTTRSLITKEYHTIYIPPFTNKVDITNEMNIGSRYRLYRPMIESDVTRAVVNQYILDGNLKPLKEGAADLILKGDVVEFRKDPLRYTDNDEVLQYRVSIVINMSLWDAKNNAEIWHENRFTGDTTFFVSGLEAKAEDAAINDAVKDLARRVVERTIEQW